MAMLAAMFLITSPFDYALLMLCLQADVFYIRSLLAVTHFTKWLTL